jgi:hypothetical protein
MIGAQNFRAASEEKQLKGWTRATKAETYQGAKSGMA